MAIRGVLFDFSGTLFRFEPVLAGLVDSAGDPMDGQRQAEVLRRMTAPVGRPGGLPESLAAEWERRDLDPGLHRELYAAVLKGSGVGNPDYLYDQLLSAQGWAPYRDTPSALARAAKAGIPTAVISNIAWDVRPTFERAEIDEYVDEFVLSYIEGAVKPDPRLFTTACERIGVAPHEVLMVGDSAVADGGAAEIGCAVALVEAVPVDERPSALLDALAEWGLG